jgi:hypothetical protein
VTSTQGVDGFHVTHQNASQGGSGGGRDEDHL